MEEWKKKLPMQLTLSRVYLLPFILLCLWPHQLTWSLVAAGLFIVASITDYYDGYFARKYNATSNAGKFMDPVADKVLVTGVLTAMIPMGHVDAYMVIILTVRDTFVGGLRAAAAADNVIIAAKTGGKWKTAMQMGAIPAVMITGLPPELGIINKLGYWLLWASVFLSITSGLDYFKAYRGSHREMSEGARGC